MDFPTNTLVLQFDDKSEIHLLPQDFAQLEEWARRLCNSRNFLLTYTDASFSEKMLTSDLDLNEVYNITRCDHIPLYIDIVVTSFSDEFLEPNLLCEEVKQQPPKKKKKKKKNFIQKRVAFVEATVKQLNKLAVSIMPDLQKPDYKLKVIEVNSILSSNQAGKILITHQWRIKKSALKSGKR